MADHATGKVPRGALFQHESFVFEGLAGEAVEQLIADVDDAGAPVVMLLKPRGGFWQWFFIDAGCNFWFEYADDVVAGLLADSTRIDYGTRFGVVGEKIGLVHAEPAPRIRVQFATGALVLETTDESEVDAPMRVRFETPVTGGGSHRTTSRRRP